MKYLLRFITSTAIKGGISRAVNVLALVVYALRGILASDGLPDSRRAQLAAILDGVLAVHDFLRKMADIVGAPISIIKSDESKIVEHSDSLYRITDAL